MHPKAEKRVDVKTNGDFSLRYHDPAHFLLLKVTLLSLKKVCENERVATIVYDFYQESLALGEWQVFYFEKPARDKTTLWGMMQRREVSYKKMGNLHGYTLSDRFVEKLKQSLMEKKMEAIEAKNKRLAMLAQGAERHALALVKKLEEMGCAVQAD